MNNSPIGFFDSGIGGLSVYARFRELLPNENTIYYGDLKNLPYGNKSKEELIGFARNILNFFKTKNVKAVIIACNTSSALAYDTIKDEYNFKIYPIIQVSAQVISHNNINRLGIFATEGTVKSKAYSKEISKHNKNILVHEIACPNWVPIVETGSFNSTDSLLDIESKMKLMLEFNPDKIILGCTHYPYLINYLKKYASKDLFIDPAKMFVDYIKSDLKNLTNTNRQIGEEEFYVSAQPELFKKNAKFFYEINTLPQIFEISKLNKN